MFVPLPLILIFVIIWRQNPSRQNGLYFFSSGCNKKKSIEQNVFFIAYRIRRSLVHKQKKKTRQFMFLQSWTNGWNNIDAWTRKQQQPEKIEHLQNKNKTTMRKARGVVIGTTTIYVHQHTQTHTHTHGARQCAIYVIRMRGNCCVRATFGWLVYRFRESTIAHIQCIFTRYRIQINVSCRAPTTIERSTPNRCVCAKRMHSAFWHCVHFTDTVRCQHKAYECIGRRKSHWLRISRGLNDTRPAMKIKRSIIKY